MYAAFKKREEELIKRFPELELMGIPRLDGRGITYDFPDDAWMNEPGIMFHRVDDKFVVNLGRVVIPMLANGFSRSGAAGLLYLAAQLKVPGGDYADHMFPNPSQLAHVSDQKYSDWPEEVINPTGRKEGIYVCTEKESKEAAIYSYISATCLRLFTKSPDNFIKAWPHILAGFRRFHGKDIQMTLPHPQRKAVESLAFFFSVEKRAKVALYRILYMSNENDSYSGYKRFLYDMHLTFTGMHIVNIFTGIIQATSCSSGLLLQLIKGPELGIRVECLKKLILLVKSKDDRHRRRMWRYGRIFDDTSMGDLQTKSLPRLVYILAYALRQVNPLSHKDILKITQLQDLSEETKKRLEAVAHRLLQVIRATTTAGNTNVGSSTSSTCETISIEKEYDIAADLWVSLMSF